jgi:peptidyl-prolyl cis-trans isomerase C
MTFALTRLALAAGLALSPVVLAAQSQEEGAQAEAAEPAAPDLSTVLATVDGEEITLGEILLMRVNLPEQFQQIPSERLFPALVDQAVTQRLLARRAREEGYDEDMAELRAEMARRSYMAESAMRGLVEAATTDEKLREAYEARLEAAEPEPQVQASHILVEEKAEAEEILEALEGGAAFAELAAERSTGPSGAQGGELGWFGQGEMVAPFAEAAFGAEVGEVVGPVETRFGWHVIKVTGKRDAPPFEEMREELAQSAAQEAVGEAVEAAKAEAEVDIRDTGIDPAVIRRDELLETR